MRFISLVFIVLCSCNYEKEAELQEKYNKIKFQDQELSWESKKIFDSMWKNGDYWFDDSTGNKRLQIDYNNVIKPISQQRKIFKKQLDSVKKLLN